MEPSGEPMVAVCARCGARERADARYCGACGAALGTPAPLPIPPPRSTALLDGMRSRAALLGTQGRAAWGRLDARTRLALALGALLLVASLGAGGWRHATTDQRWQGLPLPAYAHPDGGESRTPDGRFSAAFTVARTDASREQVAAWFAGHWAAAGYSAAGHTTTGLARYASVTGQVVTDEYTWRGPGRAGTPTYLLSVAQDAAGSGATRVTISAPPRAGAAIPNGATIARYPPGTDTQATLELVTPGLGYRELEQWFLRVWADEGYRLVDTSFLGAFYFRWYDPASERTFAYDFTSVGGRVWIEIAVQPAAADSRTPLVLGAAQRWHGLPLPVAAIPDNTLAPQTAYYHIASLDTPDQVAQWFVAQWGAAGGTLESREAAYGNQPLGMRWVFGAARYAIRIPVLNGVVTLNIVDLTK